MMRKNLDVNYFHLVASSAEGTERTLCIQMNMSELSVSQLSGNLTLTRHLWKKVLGMSRSAMKNAKTYAVIGNQCELVHTDRSAVSVVMFYIDLFSLKAPSHRGVSFQVYFNL